MSEMMCCPLDGGDGPAPKVFVKATPRAAKEHRCTECWETIQRGQEHEHARGMWDGYWSSMRTCLSCVEIRDHFACNGFIYGQLWDDLEQNFFPDMKAGGPCMEGLSPAAKARLFERCLAWRLR